jgi:phosphatidylglycerophosphate synthase
MYDKLVLIFPASIHPNTITLIGGVFAVLSNVALFNDWRWAGFILFTLYHMFDNMDGKHARRTKQASEFGAILDHFVDGTAGIWSGALGLQYALNVDPSVLAQGVWAFTFLFWAVHIVHALTGFFELGNDYLSIDEAFLVLSLVRLLHALHWTCPALLQSPALHWAIILCIYASALTWLFTHGARRTSLATLKRQWVLPAVYAAYIPVSQWALATLDPTQGTVAVLCMFAVPYGLVLWESKDKH